MNDEEFKRRLTEVAEWKIPDTPRETSLNAKKKRGRKSAEDEYQEQREEMFFEEFGGVNPTYAPMITKLKVQGCGCEDCGRFCTEGRTVETKQYESNNIKHWRKRCVTCDHSQNPYTQEFDLKSAEASAVWNIFLRDRKGKYKSKGNLARANSILKPVSEDCIDLIETDQERIVSYPRSTDKN